MLDSTHAELFAATYSPSLAGPFSHASLSCLACLACQPFIPHPPALFLLGVSVAAAKVLPSSTPLPTPPTADPHIIKSKAPPARPISLSQAAVAAAAGIPLSAVTVDNVDEVSEGMEGRAFREMYVWILLQTMWGYKY